MIFYEDWKILGLEASRDCKPLPDLSSENLAHMETEAGITIGRD